MSVLTGTDPRDPSDEGVVPPRDLVRMRECANRTSTPMRFVQSAVRAGAISVWRTGPVANGRPRYVSIAEFEAWMRTLATPVVE